MRTLRNIAIAFVALLLAASAAFIAANWAPDRPVSALTARYAQPPSQFIPLEGMSVHVRDEGPRADPTPILLIHGTSSNLHTWDGWAARVTETRRLVRMDLPAFGLTGPAPDGDYTPQRYAHFIVDLMDHLAIQRAILAGNSLGGGIAWLTAATTPNRVAGLILIDAAGYPLQSQSVPIGFHLASMPWLAPLFDHILPRSVITSSLRNVYADPARVTPALIDQYYELTLRAGNRHALAQRMAQGHFESLVPLIHTITQPTLILWGAQDHLISPGNAARFHTDIAGSTVITLPNMGHVPQEEDPAASLAAALSFLQLKQ